MSVPTIEQATRELVAIQGVGEQVGRQFRNGRISAEEYANWLLLRAKLEKINAE